MPVFLIVSAALMFGLYNVFIKMSAGHINAVLGAVVLQFVAALLGLGLLLYQQAGSAEPLQFNRAGLGLAVGAGLAIGLVEILTFVIYGRGVPVAVGNPLIIGGSLLVTTFVGIVLLKEGASWVQVGAIAMIVLGVFALAWEGV
ncbi:MAG TPA: hypothetical protein VK099_05370 [Alcanivoracaceae bacterium]|nr:hypothetical protein [Alcanivoracaceae bacterium]